MAHAVVHFEIHGPDPEALAAYYAELLGWNITLMQGGMEYRMVDTNGGEGMNGGISGNPDNAAMQIFYVECADLQGVLDKAESLGGKTAMPVSDIPGGPTIAMFTDPAGNLIGLVGPPPAGQDPQGPSKGDGAPVAWWEIHGRPFDAQVAFYKELFGWEVKESHTPEFSYGEVTTGADYGSAGAISSPSSGFTGITIWAQVDDCQKYLERAGSLGGKTDMAPTQVQDGLTVANFIDPQGNRFGLFTTG